MPVENAADRAIFLDPADFGTVVSWARGLAVTSFSAIFDADYQLISNAYLDEGAEASGPQFVARSADLPAGAVKGDSVSVTDPVTGGQLLFTALEFKPDGTGMTVVRLMEA